MTSSLRVRIREAWAEAVHDSPPASSSSSGCSLHSLPATTTTTSLRPVNDDDAARPATPPGYFSRLPTMPPGQGVPCHWGPCDHQDYRLASAQPLADDDSMLVSVSQCDVTKADAEDIPDCKYRSLYWLAD